MRWEVPLSFYVGSALASCECGYTTNTGETWQSSIITSFSADATSAQSFDAAWMVVDKIQGDITNSTPYQINYTTSNVQLSSGYANLIASAYSGSAGGAIESGQIVTQRSDILYGSFRATYSVTGGAGGACAGFFSYANDTNENDIEILSKDAGHNEIHFTNQAEDTSDSAVAMRLPDDLVTTSELTYRFDWTSTGVKYYVNDHFMTNITNNPSELASRIFLNAWSNGGVWTSGPPTQDMTMKVSRIAMYFNTTSGSNSTCSSGASTCLVDSDKVNNSGATVLYKGIASALTRVSSAEHTSSITISLAFGIAALSAFLIM